MPDLEERQSLVDPLSVAQEKTKFNTLITGTNKESIEFQQRLREIKKNNPKYFINKTEFEGWKHYELQNKLEQLPMQSDQTHDPIFSISLWKILIGVITLTIISILFVFLVLPEIKKMDNLLVGGMAAFVIISAITIYAIAKSDKYKKR